MLQWQNILLKSTDGAGTVFRYNGAAMIDKTSNRSSCLDLGLNIFGGVALCGKI